MALLKRPRVIADIIYWSNLTLQCSEDLNTKDSTTVRYGLAISYILWILNMGLEQA
jgi:hypothetical protein